MADIAAAKITERLFFNLGSLKAWKAKVQGDTGTTITLPFGRVEGYWFKNIDESAALKATESAGVLTYGSAPTTDLFHWLIVVGY